MNISPYLFFNGNCREAVVHYEKAFGVTAYVDNSEVNPALIEHAQITLCGITIMFCDWDWDEPYKKGQDFMTSIGFDETDKSVIKTAFDALAENGKIIVPLKKSEWNELSGTVMDKYGFRWNFYQM
ncbi:MAG: VOC family protein [Defluviitaleaceae bacterium]|nr:VOC family protein [Defluviitaleaceae bacterium]